MCGCITMRDIHNISILFVHRDPLASFIRNDLEILKKHFVVYSVCINLNGFKALLNLIGSISKVDVIFVWFAGFQAFISVFLAKFLVRNL